VIITRSSCKCRCAADVEMGTNIVRCNRANTMWIRRRRFFYTERLIEICSWQTGLRA